MLKFKYIFLFVCLYNTTYSQKNSSILISKAGFEKEVIYCKNDTITYLHNRLYDENIQKPLIVFVQGSKGIPLIFSDDKNFGCLIPFNFKDYLAKYNFVIISRKGIPLIGSYNKDENGYIDKNGNVPLNFKKYDNLDYRNFQLEKVL